MAGRRVYPLATDEPEFWPQGEEIVGRTGYHLGKCSYVCYAGGPGILPVWGRVKIPALLIQARTRHYPPTRKQDLFRFQNKSAVLPRSFTGRLITPATFRVYRHYSGIPALHLDHDCCSSI